MALGWAALGAGLLAGCGGVSSPSSPSSGAVTNASLASNLGLKPNDSAQTRSLGDVYGQVFPGCADHFAAFTEGGRTPTPVSFGQTIFVEVYAETASCPSSAKAQAVYSHDAAETEAQKIGGKTLSGIGSEAVMASMPTSRAHEFVIFWRDRAKLGFVQLSGPAGDERISGADTESLARRQIAAD